MNIERLKRQTLMACDIPDECECDYATDTGASYCVNCIARAWQEEHAELVATNASLRDDLRRADAVSIENGAEAAKLRIEKQEQSDKHADAITRILNESNAGYRKLSETAIRTNQALKERLADAETVNGDFAEVLANTRLQLDIYLEEVGNLQQQVDDLKAELSNRQLAANAASVS